ncbi:hypothetical protein [Terribacillus halophilus]|uniref:hypothetical protein n=1 Tax=Terribacillus halophilus TaxID=361279 RepID=UPI003982B432
MIIDINQYRKRKNANSEIMYIPVFSKIISINGESYGVLEGSGEKIKLSGLKEE